MTTASLQHNRNILISGASIGGPALAYWLSRYGFKSTIIEQAPGLRDGGYAVDFRGASVEALRRMGVLEAVRNAATNMGDMSYVNAADKPLATMPASFMSGEVEILRGDLARILYDTTKDATEYIFNDSIKSLNETKNGIDVTFERGQPRTFDLVIGADGLHSNVRRLAFGDEADFRRDLGYYVAIFTVPNDLHLDHTGRIFNVPGKLAGIYSARDNTEAKALFWFASRPLEYDHRNVDQQKHILADTFAGLGWKIPGLLEAMKVAPDFYFDSASQIRLPSYGKGRVALVGDAGYCAAPLSGMGTSLATVGAYVLAGELKAADGDYTIAFDRYTAAMAEFVKQSQKLAIGTGRSFIPPNRAEIWLRNQNLRLLPHMPWKNVIANIPAAAANSITLKDY